jgi:hypothetical protein
LHRKATHRKAAHREATHLDAMQAAQLLLKLKMETAISSANGGKPRPVWTDREIAFCLNFADFCLRERSDYRSLVTAELAKFAKRDITTTAIESKMRKTLATCSAKYADLINKGSQSLDLAKLPSQVLNIMKQQRAKWGLDELSATGDSEGSAAQGSEDAASEKVVVSKWDGRRGDSS